MTVRFSPRELLLVKKHDVCRIATINRDGWPHCVPVGYVFRLRIFFISANKESKKVGKSKIKSHRAWVIDDVKENALMI